MAGTTPRFVDVVFCVLYVILSLASNCTAAFEKQNSTGLTNAVTWDPHSLSIFGQRIFILSAEFHPWRQPNPNLWKDIFQKIKANGFNTVSFYINWALHYPSASSDPDFHPGTYRDIQMFINEAKGAGLWLIARPGPYITSVPDGETTGGGFPGWVGNIAGSLRTDNKTGNLKFLVSAWQPYMNSISQLLAKNQITNGGPGENSFFTKKIQHTNVQNKQVILVQAENEFSAGGDHSPYMQAIIDTYRANGIVVRTWFTIALSYCLVFNFMEAITFNDQHAGEAGNFSPDLGGEGAVNIYCGDSYPQGTNSWAQVQSVYYSNHEAVAFSNPLCLAEVRFGGGFLLSWGATSRGGTGYEKYKSTMIAVNLTNAQYEDVFYKENYAQTATILMLYGGTNWGQTLEPTVYTSYDYGGGINENRVLTPKMPEMRLQGLFLRVSRDLLSATLIANGTNYTTSTAIHTAELRNLASNAGYYILRHQSSPSTNLDVTKLNVSTSMGTFLIPQIGNITINGRESKILVTDYVFGESKVSILYSTTEVMTWTTIDNTDYVLLYAPQGQTGETAFVLSTRPQVSTNGANVSYDWTNGILKMNYLLNGTSFVDVKFQRTSLRVMLLDKQTAGGPYLIREAAISGNVLSLNGDVNMTTQVEVVGPSAVTKITWNGMEQVVRRTDQGTLVFNAFGPPSLSLPDLKKWKVLNSLPEAQRTFDDSLFTLADLTQTNIINSMQYTNLPPLAGSVVLYSQQYGFFGGNLIFRGHFNASGEETGVTLTVQGGVAFGYSTYLNGDFLGSYVGDPSTSVITNTWNISRDSLLPGEDNILTVFQEISILVETRLLTVIDRVETTWALSKLVPRGVRGYNLIGGNTTFTEWRIQGNFGGSTNNTDKFRGYLNEGGLYAERIGAHLPGFDDSLWLDGDPSDGIHGPGVNFYRTTFSLNLEDDFIDTPIRLSITPSNITSNFRVQIYLNGWQQAIAITYARLPLLVDPRLSSFSLQGFLDDNQENTLAISLWSLDEEGSSIAGLQLISDGTFRSSMEFKDYTDAPDYAAQKGLRPAPLYYSPISEA
ncbi:hypothetical protein Clacol_007656 [Clathrus columnatus]|uniref:beta-galactosidase n=1 Tax=Clathrus columnatus TaxID=1419009 RepID=A0AAV5AI23_9AGAM|nr:hypothetical protein Clacol_007656 [Clathrus columnatus]